MDLSFQNSDGAGGDGYAFQNGQKHWKGLRCQKNFGTIQMGPQNLAHADHDHLKIRKVWNNVIGS